MKSALLLLFLATASPWLAAATERLPTMPPGVRFEPDVAFLPEGRTEKADIYLPTAKPNGQRSPAVVIIHGGGWNGGDKRAGREINVGTNLALRGYLVMSVNYQLSNHKQAVWPTNLWDCKTAVRWLRVNAPRLGVDPARIGVLGGSAGGHLAAMVALTTSADGLDPASPYGEVSCAVNCCVDLYGIADIGLYHDVTMLGKTFAEAPELYRKASPVTYVRSNAPPFLLLHGTADKTVDLKQSELFFAALEKTGAQHKLVIVEGAPHTFHLQPKQQDLRPLVLGFFDKHLKNATAAGQ